VSAGDDAAGALPFALYLFDVDGTLVHAGGAGRRAFERALADRCGHAAPAPALHGLRLDGMTDRLIARKALDLLGLPFDEAFCDGVLERYVEHLHAEIEGPGYAVLPGVPPLLDALRARGGLVGLCTGNVVEGARLKLRRGGLDRYFDWSASAVFGFAADGEEREKLVLAALRRAAARLGRPVPPASAVVVGDTPRDVAAAHHAGCVALGVATGRFSQDELRDCGADHVAAALDHPDALRVLLGRPPRTA
jgi:phosphoglycolate phosphatase